MEIPSTFYRVSVKALVLNNNKQFLLAQEANGFWELLGGGLDNCANIQQELTREIAEETGLIVTEVATHPSYFLVDTNRHGQQIANVIYEVTLKDLNFTPSDECVALDFFDVPKLEAVDAFTNVHIFAKQFNPSNHE